MLTTAFHKMLNATDSPYKTSVRKVTSTNNKNIQAMKNKVNREKTFTVITILCAVIIIGAIGLCIYTAIGHPEDAVYYAIVIAIMAFTILYVYLISPKSIELNDTSLIMHKVVGKNNNTTRRHQGNKTIRPKRTSPVRKWRSVRKHWPVHQ